MMYSLIINPLRRTLLSLKKSLTKDMNEVSLALTLLRLRGTKLRQLFGSKFPDEQAQGWDSGMKLSISRPLPRATIISPFRWFFFRFVPLFRHYQKAESTIGTKSWAAA
jgi:hypothetical protein